MSLLEVALTSFFSLIPHLFSSTILSIFGGSPYGNILNCHKDVDNSYVSWTFQGN